MKHQPTRQGQTTTPGTMCPTLFDKYVGFLMSPTDYIVCNTEDAGEGAYGLWSFSEKFPVRILY